MALAQQLHHVAGEQCRALAYIFDTPDIYFVCIYILRSIDLVVMANTLLALISRHGVCTQLENIGRREVSAA